MAFIWDTERFERKDSHEVLIYFFDELGKSLVGQQAGGSHQFPDINQKDKSKLEKIARDFIEFKPELACLANSVIANL